MNKQFVEQQKQALEILEVLAKEAAKRKETLVFIGGSAIQTAVLKKARRLSVDLDMYYSGNADELLDVLKGDYQFEKRKAERADLFHFSSAVREAVKVKIDVARFRLADGEPYTVKTLGARKFKVNVATPEYLLASKMSALAFGTVGRRNFEPTDFLKDVFDANALIDEYGFASETVGYFQQVCNIQNQINKTSFSEPQILESIANALYASALTDDAKATIKKANLMDFNASYSLGSAVRKPEYWVMVCRLAAYSSVLALKGRAPDVAKEIEKRADEKYADREFAAMCEQKLVEAGIDAKQLHELKILAPKALVYLYYTHYLPGDNPITTETPGRYKPRFS